MNRDEKSCGVISSIASDNWLRDRFTKNVEEVFNSCKDLIIRKNSDYTKLNGSDPFFNFRQECVDLFLFNTKINDKVDGITLGLLTRLNDKRRRRENLLLTSGSLVIDETIEDTIKDEVNYLVILLCHLKINGRHLLEKPEERETPWQEEALNNRNAQIVQLYAALEEQKSHNTILAQRLEKKNPKNARRNPKSK